MAAIVGLYDVRKIKNTGASYILSKLEEAALISCLSSHQEVSLT